MARMSILYHMMSVMSICLCKNNWFINSPKIKTFQHNKCLGQQAGKQPVWFILLAMRIAIVGWGIEGQSAFRYFGPDHNYLIVNEEPSNNFPPESNKIKLQFIDKQRTPGVTSKVADLSYLNGIEACDKIIYTPTSVFNLQKAYGDNQAFWAKTTTAQHIFFETVKTKNIIGVTGSKGKGTTCTLTTKMLQAVGKKVWLGGNIGESVLDFVREVGPDDWVVLELANFQLYNFPYSPHIGVCLMVTLEHQDWHATMDDYIQAKSNLFAHQKPDDIAIYFANNTYSKQVAAKSPGHKIPYYHEPGALVRDDGMIVIGGTEICNKSEVKLLGEHNLQNICAAVTTVWQVSQDADAAKKALVSFTGLEHRLEFVRELDGVKYYDDSFATTPDTAIVALRAFVQPAVIILGGWDKGLDFGPLIEEISQKDRVRQVITIGQTGPKIAQMLRAKHFTAIAEGLEKMSDIVAEAKAKAQPGDVVLLSCGTSSFGLFHDYKDRGNQFKAAVQELS